MSNISFLHNHCSLNVLHLESPDEDVDKVDEGELYEGAEDGDEAEDDVHVEGGGVAHGRPETLRSLLKRS